MANIDDTDTRTAKLAAVELLYTDMLHPGDRDLVYGNHERVQRDMLALLAELRKVRADVARLEEVTRAIESRFKAEVGPLGTKLDEAYVEGWRDCHTAIVKALRAAPEPHA